MSKPRWTIPTKVEEALNATGLPWTVEPGGKHIHVRLAGRLVAGLHAGRGTEQEFYARSMIGSIRRMAKAIKSG